MKRRAFTLIEVMVSLAILAGLLVALNQFVFGMGDLWGKGADRRLFERHVNAVSHRIQNLILTAGGTPGQDHLTRIAVLSVRTEDGRHADMLTWELAGVDDSVIPTRAPRADVICSIEVVRGRGLLLNWQSKLEKNFETSAFHSMSLTPFCEGIDYDYHDTGSRKWETGTAMEKESDGSWRLPQRFRLHFAHGDWRLDRTILVATAPADGGLPSY